MWRTLGRQAQCWTLFVAPRVNRLVSLAIEDINGAAQFGAMSTQVTQLNGERCSAAKGLLDAKSISSKSHRGDQSNHTRDSCLKVRSGWG